MSSRHEPRTLAQAVAAARHVVLADWVGGAVERRDYEYRSTRFSLEHRLCTILEDLRPVDGLWVDQSGDEVLLRSPHSGASGPPAFEAGTRIRVGNGPQLDLQLDAIERSQKHRIWESYEPPRPVTGGPAILLLGRYDLRAETFWGVHGWGMLPPELLSEVRPLLKPAG